MSGGPSASVRPRILLVADTDSRYKWAGLVASALAAGIDGEVTSCVVRSAAMPSSRQIREVGLDLPWFTATMGELETGDTLAHYDIVVLAVIGSRIGRLIHAVGRIFAQRGDRPLVVTGWVGVVYELQLEGFLWRVGADAICVNSGTDERLFRDHCRQLDLDRSALVRTGFFVAPTPIARPPADVRRVLFVTQPSVPRRRDERLHVLTQLLAYRARYPERAVVVKLRSRPDEATSHPEQFHYQELFEAEFPGRCGALEFRYGRMEDALADTDLCLTVSSTAALEAMARGIPTGILTDFGLGERLGNHFFVGSGTATSFPKLLRDELPVVDVAWLRRHGFDDRDTVGNLMERVRALLAAPRTPPRQWYGPEATGYVYERVILNPSSAAATRNGSRSRSVKRQVQRLLYGPGLRTLRRLSAWLDR